MGKANVPHRRYTAEFKSEALRLSHEVGVGEAARRLDIPVSSLDNWRRIERRTESGAPVEQTSGDLQSELNRLRRENASLKLDNEILRKATAYFAKGSR
jgi:transposase